MAILSELHFYSIRNTVYYYLTHYGIRCSNAFDVTLVAISHLLIKVLLQYEVALTVISANSSARIETSYRIHLDAFKVISGQIF